MTWQDLHLVSKKGGNFRLEWQRSLFGLPYRRTELEGPIRPGDIVATLDIQLNV